MTDDLVGLIERDDHARGCEGRWYACSCGYEARIEAGIRQAAARIEALEELVEAAFKEGISTGYQCGKADETTTDEWHAAWLASDASATARVAQHLKQENSHG